MSCTVSTQKMLEDGFGSLIPHSSIFISKCPPNHYLCSGWLFDSVIEKKSTNEPNPSHILEQDFSHFLRSSLEHLYLLFLIFSPTLRESEWHNSRCSTSYLWTQLPWPITSFYYFSILPLPAYTISTISSYIHTTLSNEIFFKKGVCQSVFNLWGGGYPRDSCPSWRWFTLPWYWVQLEQKATV